MGLRDFFRDTAEKRLAHELLSAERKQVQHEQRADRKAAKVVGGGRRAARANERAGLMDPQIERLRAKVEADPLALRYYREWRADWERRGMLKPMPPSPGSDP